MMLSIFLFTNENLKSVAEIFNSPAVLTGSFGPPQVFFTLCTVRHVRTDPACAFTTFFFFYCFS